MFYSIVPFVVFVEAVERLFAAVIEAVVVVVLVLALVRRKFVVRSCRGQDACAVIDLEMV